MLIIHYMFTSFYLNEPHFMQYTQISEYLIFNAIYTIIRIMNIYCNIHKYQNIEYLMQYTQIPE